MSNYSSLSRILSPFRVQTLSPSQEQTKIEEISLPANIGSKCVYFFVVLAKPLGESSAVHITEENNTIDVGNEEGSNKANQWTLWKVEDFIEALEDIEDSNTETFIKHNSMVKSYGP
uniref:Uncharacterized protein n=1 Tax=Rhizophagus irregularis (strain DAOM 181602 / DAOM 197198 / MUCL 43194) TaxID=747089 RepID=U9UVU4_RHIID